MKAREINQKMRSIMNTRTGLKAVGVFAVYLVISSIISYIGGYLPLSKEAYTAYLYMVNLLVLPALSIGYQKFNLDLYRGKKATAGTLFEGFTRRYYMKSVLTTLLLILLILALSIVVAIVVSILSIFIAPSIPMSSDLMGLAIVLGILSIVLFVVIFYCLAPFSQTYYRIIDNSSAGSWKAITSSSTMMKGRIWKYAVQHLSLLPLILLPIILNGLILLLYGVILKDFPTFHLGTNLLTNFVNFINTLLVYLESKFTSIYIVSIVTSLLINPRISMSFAIWYDDKAREADLQIED